MLEDLIKQYTAQKKVYESVGGGIAESVKGFVQEVGELCKQVPELYKLEVDISPDGLMGKRWIAQVVGNNVVLQSYLYDGVSIGKVSIGVGDSLNISLLNFSSDICDYFVSNWSSIRELMIVEYEAQLVKLIDKREAIIQEYK